MDTIPGFLAKENCGVIKKTQKILETETKRVEFHKQARENAIKLYTDKKAYFILSEEKDNINKKKYKAYLKDQEREMRDKKEEERKKGLDALKAVKKKIREIEGCSLKAHLSHIEDMKEMQI